MLVGTAIEPNFEHYRCRGIDEEAEMRNSEMDQILNFKAEILSPCVNSSFLKLQRQNSAFKESPCRNFRKSVQK